MIKRSTAFFYILFTSVVLLAHAVIPHHYHENEIFIINSDCQPDNGEHKHGPSAHNHENHNESNAHNCVIQQVDVVRSNQVKYEVKSQDCTDNHSKFKGFKVDLLKNGLSVPFSTILSNTQAFLLSSTYSTFASTGLGLRAPPPVV